jgi:predicted lipid-binding transport protein (Tim44 family)
MSRQRESDLEGGEEAIKEHDPDFSLSNFAKRVSGAFLKIQEAWTGNDMRKARHFISDGIFERFSLQLEMQKASDINNQMTDINVHSVDVVAVNSSRFFDSIDLKITASSVDKYLKASSGSIDVLRILDFSAPSRSKNKNRSSFIGKLLSKLRCAA